MKAKDGGEGCAGRNERISLRVRRENVVREARRWGERCVDAKVESRVKTRRGLQSAEEEDTTNGDFLGGWNLQLDDREEWDDEEGDVDKDIEYGL